MMMMTTMIEMLFCLFPLLSFSLGCVFVNETNDIVDLANCDGATERRTDGWTDMTSYRDAEAHLKNKTQFGAVLFSKIALKIQHGSSLRHDRRDFNEMSDMRECRKQNGIWEE